MEVMEIMGSMEAMGVIDEGVREKLRGNNDRWRYRGGNSELGKRV